MFSSAEDSEKTGVLFLLLVPFLARAKPETVARRRRAYLRFREALAYIDAHLAEPPRVSELARVSHLERTYFSRLFQSQMGVKPAAYILRRRIEKAKQRLWTTEEPLRAIAESLGFSDAFHLSKSFKRLVGMSPSDFRGMRGRPA